MHSAWTKILKIVATFVYASSQGQCTHSARTNFLYNIVLEYDPQMAERGPDKDRNMYDKGLQYG